MIGVETISARTVASVRGVQALFLSTTFTASALLFVVQPMFARLVLPKLGGSPAVWNTCVLFFQTMLLLGYLYAHVATERLGVRRQAQLHIGVMLTALLLLPLSLGGAEPQPGASPVWWLLKTLTTRLGLPFLVLSTMAPLVQRWFASLPVPSASNPYFMYSASNLGSMLALLAYPLILEPTSGTRAQTQIWSVGYGVLLLLTLGCVFHVYRYGREIVELDPGGFAPPEPPTPSLAGPHDPRSAPAGAPVARLARYAARRKRVQNSRFEPHDGLTDPRHGSPPSLAHSAPAALLRARWVLLAFVPSSLMLGVTMHISTDLASIPLLWVLPLAAYLLTFILAFSTRQAVPVSLAACALPVLVLAVMLSILFHLNAPMLVPLHLVGFFAAAFVCHTALSNSRPPAEHLTDFYLWMSVGGTLGGVFNTLIAPHVFTGVFEYPLLLTLACFVRPSPGYRRGKLEPWHLVATLAVVPLVVLLVMFAMGKTPPAAGLTAVVVISAIVSAAAFTMLNRTVPFNLIVVGALVFTIAASELQSSGASVFAARSFFGVSRVIEARDGSYHLLQHGSTLHGRQNLPAGSACDPQAYYHPSSPVGDVFLASGERFKDVGVIGLGSGGLACYAQAGDNWTFFEIDPLIERIARDARLFTFLQNTPGTIRIAIGDGRKKLEEVAPGSYDLIVLDAFSSDSVPVHLVTREALQLYLSRLRPGGVIAYHISNRYLELEPVVATLAAGQGLKAVARRDDQIPAADAARGRIGSHWVVVTASADPIARLQSRPGWRVVSRPAGGREWTDDYSNLVETVRFLK